MRSATSLPRPPGGYGSIEDYAAGGKPCGYRLLSPSLRRVAATMAVPLTPLDAGAAGPGAANGVAYLGRALPLAGQTSSSSTFHYITAVSADGRDFVDQAGDPIASRGTTSGT